MPSYAELEQEPEWQDEYEPAELVALGNRIESFYPGVQVWIRGDNEHLRGYHRSRRWIKNSIHCTNRTYSVSRTSGDAGGGDPNWAAAMDIGNIDQATLHAICKRLDAACRQGKLEKITEWYGNLGNDSLVDGWDNISNIPATSDSSHLYHLHMSFDRGHANDDHTDLFEILTGGAMTQGDHNMGYVLQNGVFGVEHPDVHIPAEGDFTANVWPSRFAEVLRAIVEGRDAHLPAFIHMPAQTWTNGTMAALDGLSEQIADLSVASVDIPVLVEQLVPALTAALDPVIRQIVRQELDHTKLGNIA